MLPLKDMEGNCSSAEKLPWKKNKNRKKGEKDESRDRKERQ